MQTKSPVGRRLPKKLVRPKNLSNRRSPSGVRAQIDGEITHQSIADFLWDRVQRHARGEISDQRLQAISMAAAQIRAALSARDEQTERRGILQGFGENLSPAGRLALHQMLNGSRPFRR